MTTRNLDDLTGKHACLFACKEKDGFGNVFWLNELAHRDDGENGLFQFFVNPSRLCRSGCHTIHGDAILSHLECYASGERF